MDRTHIPQRIIQGLLQYRRKIANKRGSAMFLAIVLTAAILPATAGLTVIANSDLTSAREDYYNVKANYAARGAITLVEADLLAGGDGHISWPDSETEIDIEVTISHGKWEIQIQARTGNAVSNLSTQVEIP